MEIEVNSVYRVNHSNCPKSASLPPSLNSIKSVLVKKISDEEVTVGFPSKKSLNKFFGGENVTGSMQPSLDEKFVMGLNLGKKILTQKIPFEEFASQRGSKIFWVFEDHHNNDEVDQDHDDDEIDDDNGDYDKKSSSEGLGVKWETRRRTRYYTRRKNAINQKISSSNKVIKVNHGDNQAVVAASMEVSCEDEGLNNKEEKVVLKVEEVEEKPRILRKRKCQFKGVKYRDDSIKKKKMKKKKMSSNNAASSSQKKFIDSQHRWTVERYNLAEMNMLKVMKEKGADPSNPVLRPDLRAEARKLIGDTGLLDHLLKHMAGKLAPGGKERFCRRHNPEGAMEYWIEGADLIEIRKQAGVDNPYWVPPSGWKPGDCPTQDPVCSLQLMELKEEVFNMKREIGEMSCSRVQENSQLMVIEPENAENAVETLNVEESLKPLKETYEELMKRKADIEKQLLNISKSFSEMEEDIERLKQSAEPDTEVMSQNAEEQTREMSEREVEEMLSQLQESAPTEDKAVVETKAAEVEERRQKPKSGFRICKPQGTFLLPSQVPSSSQSQEVVYIEDFLGYPTPPSVSSSSRTPALIFPQSPYYQHQPQQRPPVLRPVASRAAVTLTFSTATIKGSTTIESIASPTTTTSSSAHNFVPDLNQVPVS